MKRRSFLFAATMLPLAGQTRASQIQISKLHPRIFLRHDAATEGEGPTVSRLRQRWKDAAYAGWRAPSPGEGTVATIERAARFLEAGSREDLEAVREFLTTRTFSFRQHDVGGFLAGAYMATAFDWAYAGLAEGDRRQAMENIVTTADSSRDFLLRGGPDINHNYTYMALNTVATCGLVLAGEAEPFELKASEYLALADRFIETPGMVLDTWNAREAAWAEGSHYTFFETFRNLVLMLQAYRSASTRDYFALAEQKYGNFAAKGGRFLIASTRPDMTFERIGDCSPSRIQGHTWIPITMEALAAGLGDPDEAARFRSFAQALRDAYGADAVPPAYGWGMRVFHDSAAPRTPSYHTLPLAIRLGAGTYDHIAFRNGWGPDSTLVTILAGDHFTDHQHFDKGHFLIYRRGGLLIDGGAYDRMYQPEGHWTDYAVRTVAHNCVLVYDSAQKFPKNNGNDGGQNVLRGIQHHRDWPTYVAHREAGKEGLNTADVLAYESDGNANEYSYVRIDLRGAYSDKITHYDRQFAYLPAQDFLVVYDRVSSTDPAFPKRWLLHFQDRPEIDGVAPEPGVRKYPGASLTTQRRRGRLELGGSAWQYDGVLFARTVLPESREIIAVGGPGYEYYSLFEGRNYPPSRENIAAPVREAGTWRIEVAPGRPARDDQFLHALQMADTSARAPVEARLLRDSERKLAGAVLLAPAETQVVMFAAGQRGGPVQLPATYEIDSALPGRHLVVELPPEKEITVTVNGKPILKKKVSSQGVVTFEDKFKGKRTVRIS